MRRIELVNAVAQINEAIEFSEIDDALNTFIQGPKASSETLVPQLLKSLKSYSILAEDFTPAAKTIEKIFDLKILSDPVVWAGLFKAEPHSIAIRLIRNLNFVRRYLPGVIDLLTQETLQSIEKAKDSGDPRFIGKSILSVLVIEEPDRLSRPARLMNVLDSMQLLYDGCAVVEDSLAENLSVVACDSGSDKSFDFLGAAKVVECVKEVILSLWDRIVFYREHQFSERLELITKALPIMERISVLEEEKRLGREQAEIVRRNILGGINKFVESGATIPEIEERAHFSPRKLMSSSPKLLTSSFLEDSSLRDDQESRHEAPSETLGVTEANISNLDDKERELLRQLLNKTREKE